MIADQEMDEAACVPGKAGQVADDARAVRAAIRDVPGLHQMCLAARPLIIGKEAGVGHHGDVLAIVTVQVADADDSLNAGPGVARISCVLHREDEHECEQMGESTRDPLFSVR